MAENLKLVDPDTGERYRAGDVILRSGTDRSGTAGTGSTSLAAANPKRRGLNIQNISANNLGVNEFGGTAAIGSPGTYTIPAGGSMNVRTTQAIMVTASGAGSAYTATEY